MCEMPTRKPTRLKCFDYNLAGTYFITICSKNRECIFGEVVKTYIADDLDENVIIPWKANVLLSEYGQIVKKYIESGKNAYENMTVDNYIIMPNHIHLIIYIKKDGTSTTKANTAIAKFVSALKRLVNKEIGLSVFQRSYHDRIIRNEKEYDNIWDYIDSNPACWEKDCLNENICAQSIRHENNSNNSV